MTITETPNNSPVTRGNTDVLTAREYLRVSFDGSGRERSLTEQSGDNRRAATGNGWPLGEPYRDNSRSASRYATRNREGYDQLISDLEHDRFDAQVLIIWESSRGSRRTGEWITLIELCEERNVKIFVTTHGRLYDPGNGRDRKSLLEDAIDSEYEAYKIRDRVKRSAAANVAEGKPHGRVPFGYRRRYDPVTRRLVAQEPDPDTAPLIRELFDKIAAGRSLHSIAREWDERGIRNAKGTPYTPAHLRALAITSTYAGIREYRPASRGQRRQRQQQPVSVVKGTWEPLVSQETFLAVQSILNDPKRRTNRPGRGKYLLSMIAKCAQCGSPLAVRRERNTDWYVCHSAKSCVRCRRSDLDDHVTDAILLWLVSDEATQSLSVSGDLDRATVQAARDDVAAIEAELLDLGRQVGAGLLSATLAAQAEPLIRKRLAEAEKRLKEVGTPDRLRGLIKPDDRVVEQWESMEMPAKREVARLVLVPDLLGEVRLHKAPRTGARFPVIDRLEFVTNS